MNTNRRNAELVITKYIKQPPATMYDLGVGMNSEWKTLGEVYPQMKLYGCEPNIAEYERLDGVFPGRLANIAIADVNSYNTMLVAPLDSGGSTLFTEPNGNNYPIIHVPTWTLDYFDDLMGCPDRILLWMDIEGCELIALQSAPNLMASGRVRWISVEVYSDPPAGRPHVSDVYSHLEALGYVMVREYNHQGSHFDQIYVHKDEM